MGAGALLLAGTAPANADNLDDEVVAGGSTSLVLSGGTASTGINYSIHKTGQNCDPADGSPAVVTLAVANNASGAVTMTAAAGVLSSDNKLTFTACGSPKTVTFTATAAGTYPVTARVADTNNGGDTYAEHADFTLTVTAPTNTAPTVAVTGVTDGDSYELGSVPTAGCQVNDAQDGASTKAATLSAINGPLAAYGIGSQTATCTATDSGGLSATPASATYSIVDTTAPALTVPAGQVLEATSATGAVATWSGPSATDLGTLAPGSPSCDYASGATFPLGTTTVSCSATDPAGNTAAGSFTVEVQDTTAPVISGGAGATVEATGPSTVVGYTEPTASDTVSGPITPACVPPSGSGFSVGDTTVTCTAGDAAGNSSGVELHVIVTDTTGPAIDVPHLDAVEATGPSGAAVPFSVSASDLVDGATSVGCDYESGDTFPLGTTLVTCTSEDSRHNSSSASFSVEVVDTTAPALTVPGGKTAEATGPTGATVTFSASAVDIVDGNVNVDCIPASGSVFGLGETTVTCTAKDAAGNQAQDGFTVTVVDTTPPVVTAPADQLLEATSPGGATATFSATADDIVDGDVAATCDPPSGSLFPLGETTVTCSATDQAGNPGSDTFKVKVVDTTAPVLTLPDDIVETATSAAGATATYTATANDVVDGDVPVTCTPASGNTFAPGVTTVHCSATDAHHNTANGSFTVTVEFAWNGFFAPVDNSGVLNAIKGGQSVPMKWNIPNGSGGWISSLAVVGSVKQTTVTCANNAVVDEIEAPTSGATSLRYDATANQYIYNWQSPKGAGVCYKVTVTLTDHSVRSALFKTK